MIIIIGKRWFDKTYGNTYHSVRITEDGKEIAYAPYQYGYGDGYKQTAHKLLQEAGMVPKTGKRQNGMDVDYSEFITGESRDTSKYTWIVLDVQRKKDL